MTKIDVAIDTANYYASYVSFVPILSSVSGITHLICAIRDRAFGKPEIALLGENSSRNNCEQNAREIAYHKLDNWSECTKGFLALIPFVGNLILFGNWINRRLDYATVINLFERKNSYLNINTETIQRLPELLLGDKEFISLLFDVIHYKKTYCGVNPFAGTQLFVALSRILKDDIPFIHSRLKRGDISAVQCFSAIGENARQDEDCVGDFLSNAASPGEIAGMFFIFKHFRDNERWKNIFLESINRVDATKEDKERAIRAMSIKM